MSFLKGTKFAKAETKIEESAAPVSKPKLGGAKPSPLKTGIKPIGKPGSLTKKKSEPKEVEIDEVVQEKEEVEIASKPKLSGKILGAKTPKTEKVEKEPKAEVIKFEEVITEEPAEEKKITAKKKTTSKKNTKVKKEESKEEQEIIKSLEIDETKRISLEEMDTIMRPIVAPTTAFWEQEKKDVIEALNGIKVEQDMNMGQVKNCLSVLDELKFEILPKQHDAETMYDGTKQNYDTVKAVAIARGNGSNAESRKAEGILACQNFVTPSGEVVDLHQYMLLIEERYKFYEKISDGVNFKKYSLVNYNNAIKAEKEGK